MCSINMGSCTAEEKGQGWKRRPYPSFFGPSWTWKWLKKSCKRNKTSEIKVWPQEEATEGRVETWNGTRADQPQTLLQSTDEFLRSMAVKGKTRVSKQEERPFFSVTIELQTVFLYSWNSSWVTCISSCCFFVFRSINGRTECCSLNWQHHTEESCQKWEIRYT